MHPSHHWDVIEGQGSLFHPAYAAVSLGLLHGSQPDVIVVCHEPGRTHILGYPSYPMPGIERDDRIELAARPAHQRGDPLRGSQLEYLGLGADEAARMLSRESERLGLPVADPIRGGPPFERLVDACLG